VTHGPDLPDSAAQLLLQSELAARWRISPRTLERWRSIGTGPDWLRLGARILYRLDDVLAYEQACLRQP
jgi:hypothetical protein